MKKVYVVGFDAMIMPLVKRFAREGVLPNFSRMMQRGATNEVIPSFPPWTPTNWATLITGADTGSHGVAGWYVKTPDGKQVSAFDSRAVKAETIFEVADRNGIRSVAFHYPATMPARVKDGYVVDGFGHPGRNSPYQVAPSRGYTTVAGVPDSDIISFQPAADGWTNVPISRGKPLAARIEVRKHAQESNAVVLWLLLLDNAGKGYDTIAVCAQPDGQSEICRASAGEWTKWVHIQVGGAKGMVRFKPLQISRDGSVVKLYRSQVTPLDGFTYPDELGKHLIDKFGPYLEHASHHTYTASIGDFATALEEADYQAQWIAKAGVHMMNQKGCRLFYCHWHWLDHVSHIHLSGIDPVSPLFSVDEMERHLHCLRQSYAAADRMIGTILSSIDEDTYVLAISDHGNAPDVRVIDIQRFLWQKGYLVLKDPSREGNRSTTWEDIDWQRTTAYQDPGMPSFNIWINAEPGSKRYREIQMDLVHDLRTWVDPVINRTPIALALSKEA
ncbi:MAG: alkaline phosphatase family protein, partial [Bacillota bacterium]